MVATATWRGRNPVLWQALCSRSCWLKRSFMLGSTIESSCGKPRATSQAGHKRHPESMGRWLNQRVNAKVSRADQRRFIQLGDGGQVRRDHSAGMGARQDHGQSLPLGFIDCYGRCWIHDPDHRHAKTQRKQHVPVPSADQVKNSVQRDCQLGG